MLQPCCRFFVHPLPEPQAFPAPRGLRASRPQPRVAALSGKTAQNSVGVCNSRSGPATDCRTVEIVFGNKKC